MNRADIIDTVNNIFVDEFEIEESIITPTAPMRETLDLDSLDYVDLVVIIESNFGVKLVEADFAQITTFDDFYTLIETKIK
ncbi:MAG: phosphopantetheine-binding protein [Bacteroidota bacterium]|nr:phosphopantetheine-binding protein [Bacteroidota bacterium]